MAQGRGNAKAIVCALALLAVLQAVAAKDFNVGGTLNWNYPPGTDPTYYDTWASQQAFAPGDNLVFTYGAGMHDVQVVSAAEYSACTVSNGQKFTSGSDTIPLPKAGDYYFLCSYVSHCEQNMKMKVTVKAGATPPAVAPVAPPPRVTPPPALPPVEEPTTPPTAPPTVPPTAPPVVPPVAPPVKAPAPAPVIVAPVPAPVIAPTPVPEVAPTPVPEVAPTPVSVVAPTPEVVPEPTAEAPPAPPPSAGQSVRVCLSFVGAAAVVAFGALLF